MVPCVEMIPITDIDTASSLHSSYITLAKNAQPVVRMYWQWEGYPDERSESERVGSLEAITDDRKQTGSETAILSRWKAPGGR